MDGGNEMKVEKQIKMMKGIKVIMPSKNLLKEIQEYKFISKKGCEGFDHLYGVSEVLNG
jgi:hypothetical protein